MGVNQIQCRIVQVGLGCKLGMTRGRDWMDVLDVDDQGDGIGWIG